MFVQNSIHAMGQLIGILKPLASGLASSPASQNAYLDPGSGSFLLQLLLAALLGGLFLLKAYWGKLIAFFRRVTNRENNTEDDE